MNNNWDDVMNEKFRMGFVRERRQRRVLKWNRNRFDLFSTIRIFFSAGVNESSKFRRASCMRGEKNTCFYLKLSWKRYGFRR
jgi:hypothetical protein